MRIALLDVKVGTKIGSNFTAGIQNTVTINDLSANLYNPQLIGHKNTGILCIYNRDFISTNKTTSSRRSIFVGKYNYDTLTQLNAPIELTNTIYGGPANSRADIYLIKVQLALEFDQYYIMFFNNLTLTLHINNINLSNITVPVYNTTFSLPYDVYNYLPGDIPFLSNEDMVFDYYAQNLFVTYLKYFGITRGYQSIITQLQ